MRLHTCLLEEVPRQALSLHLSCWALKHMNAHPRTWSNTLLVDCCAASLDVMRAAHLPPQGAALTDNIPAPIMPGCHAWQFLMVEPGRTPRLVNGASLGATSCVLHACLQEELP